MVKGFIIVLPHAEGIISNLDARERQRITNAVFSLSDDGHLLARGTHMTFGVSGFLEQVPLRSVGV